MLKWIFAAIIVAACCCLCRSVNRQAAQTLVALQSVNYPQDYIRTTNGSPRGAGKVYGLINADYFYIHPGLNEQADTVSLESLSFPGFYLRQYTNGLMYLESFSNPRNPSSFLDDASFYLREDKYYPGSVSFESYTNANSFIRHQGNVLKMSPYQDTDLFRMDASWYKRQIDSRICYKPCKNGGICRTTNKGVNFCECLPGFGGGVCGRPGTVALQSRTDSNIFVGLNDATIKEARALYRTQKVQFYIRPGLTGEKETVSFESKDHPGYFLRHYGAWLYLEPASNPRNPGIFNLDATFRYRQSYWINHYDAYESINYPNRFISIVNGRLRIAYVQGTDDFRKRSSWYPRPPQDN